MAVVQAEDVTPVRTRISWGAIVAGAVVAFSLHFLLSLLGAAVGLSVRDTVDPQNLKMSVAAFAIAVTALCLFVGGYVASLLTAGENRSESLLYGVLVWAVVFAGLIGLAASGMRTGIGAMSGLAKTRRTRPPPRTPQLGLPGTPSSEPGSRCWPRRSAGTSGPVHNSAS